MSESPIQRADGASEPGKGGNYVVVARRYRPRSFQELVGQQHVGQALKNAIETCRVGHAYLFTGARGVGKTSTARIFAKALNDPSGPTATPDQDSDVAQSIDAGEDVDVIEIDGASNRGIDEIRSLRANIGVRPSRSRYKIYIIDEVHMLTTAAFNALLKTLEEPPEHVKFIFCTTDPEKIPITVLSRCQRFDFAPVEIQKIVERLRFIVDSESASADDEALELIARRATGSMRDSQSLLEQVLSFSNGKLTANQVHAMLGTADDQRLHALAVALADRDAASALRQLDAGIDAGVDAGRLAEQLLGYFRDLMAVAVGCDAGMMRHTSDSLFQELQELAQRWGLHTVLAVVGLVDQTLVRVRHSVYSRVLLEATLIQICNLPDLQPIADLAAASRAAVSSLPPGSRAPTTRDSASQLGNTSQLGNRVDSVSDDAPEKKKPETVTPLASPASQTQQVVRPVDKTVTNSVVEALVRDDDDGGRRQFERADAPALKPQAGHHLLWNQPTAERIWQQTLGNLESMIEPFARVVDSVEAEGERTLRLTFPHDGALAKRRCELPEHRTALLQALAQAAGESIALEFGLARAPAVQKPMEPVTAKPSRMQRMREIEANPLIKSCLDLFDAEIVRIEHSK